VLTRQLLAHSRRIAPDLRPDEGLGPVAEAPLEPVDVADQDLQEVVELVRDAVGEEAERSRFSPARALPAFSARSWT
jgi:hypothetical protein